MTEREKELEEENKNLRDRVRKAEESWKAHVTRRLDDLDKNTAELIAQSDVNAAFIKRISDTLTGNGDPQKGLIVRVDRLEQSKETHMRAYWLVVTAAVTGLISGIWSLMTHKQ